MADQKKLSKRTRRLRGFFGMTHGRDKDYRINALYGNCVTDPIPEIRSTVGGIRSEIRHTTRSVKTLFDDPLYDWST